MPKNYNLFLKGGVGDWDFNADMVSYVLDKHKDSEVHVLIDSLGGYTHVAVSISSLFKLHGNVHVHFVGHNASAATIAAMGAKRITIDEDAAFLVHKCLVPVVEWDYMNADQLDEHIKKLEAVKKDNETIDSCIAGMYARRCKKPKEDLLALMKVGGWLTPEQALEWGFVDEITHFKEDGKPELSEAAISSLYDAGIPLPPNFNKKEGSFLDRLIKAFTPNSKPVADDKVSDATQSVPKMSKPLTTLCALLGATVAVTDGKLTLTAELAEKLEDAIAAHQQTVDDLNSTIADKDTKINDLNAKIADLVKAPAAVTSNVTEDSKNEKTFNGANPEKLAEALLEIIP